MALISEKCKKESGHDKNTVAAPITTQIKELLKSANLKRNAKIQIIVIRTSLVALTLIPKSLAQFNQDQQAIGLVKTINPLTVANLEVIYKRYALIRSFILHPLLSKLLFQPNHQHVGPILTWLHTHYPHHLHTLVLEPYQCLHIKDGLMLYSSQFIFDKMVSAQEAPPDITCGHDLECYTHESIKPNMLLAFLQWLRTHNQYLYKKALTKTTHFFSYAIDYNQKSEGIFLSSYMTNVAILFSAIQEAFPKDKAQRIIQAHLKPSLMKVITCFMEDQAELSSIPATCPRFTSSVPVKANLEMINMQLKELTTNTPPNTESLMHFIQRNLICPYTGGSQHFCESAIDVAEEEISNILRWFETYNAEGIIEQLCSKTQQDNLLHIVIKYAKQRPVDRRELFVHFVSMINWAPLNEASRLKILHALDAQNNDGMTGIDLISTNESLSNRFFGTITCQAEMILKLLPKIKSPEFSIPFCVIFYVQLINKLPNKSLIGHVPRQLIKYVQASVPACPSSVDEELIRKALKEIKKHTHRNATSTKKTKSWGLCKRILTKKSEYVAHITIIITFIAAGLLLKKQNTMLSNNNTQSKATRTIDYLLLVVVAVPCVVMLLKCLIERKGNNHSNTLKQELEPPLSSGAMHAKPSSTDPKHLHLLTTNVRTLLDEEAMLEIRDEEPLDAMTQGNGTKHQYSMIRNN
jgi:hypothetical protein